MDTLVLNKDARPLSLLPLSTISWQDAIKFIWMDKSITVLEWYEDWVVRSPSWETRVPAVIMLNFYVKKTQKLKPTRYNIALRDHFKCQYCGQEVTLNTSTRDHVYPSSLGGDSSWSNLVTSCAHCNTTKGSKLINPMRKPHHPDYYELCEIRRSLPFDIQHDSWELYI